MSFWKKFLESDSTQNLRIIITRHGERTDFALGPGWTHEVANSRGRDSRISYLTPRKPFFEWEFDTPLTSYGERQSRSVGQRLWKLGYQIDYCYSSPAYRSIQTATNILKGQGRQAVPIKIEPGLFECPIWYGENPIVFVPPQHLATDPHFNVDATYRPMYTDIDRDEDEAGYYHRSRLLIDKIVRHHKKRGGTILLSGHAGSIETLTRGIRRVYGSAEHLYALSGKVDYCNFAILERDASTGEWTVHHPGSYENPSGARQPVQTSIPLYRISSQAVLANRQRNVFFDEPEVFYEDGLSRSHRHRRRLHSKRFRH